MTTNGNANQLPYWRSVHEAADKLPDLPRGSVRYLTSLDLPTDPHWREGVVVPVPAENKNLAGQRLVERTHRLSTPDEIQAYEQRIARQADECALIEAAREKTKTGILKLSVAELEKLGRT